MEYQRDERPLLAVNSNLAAERVLGKQLHMDS